MDTYFHVVPFAGSGCEGCCCEGNESLICLKRWRKVLRAPIDMNTKLWCWWFPFLSLSVCLIFISGRPAIRVCCLWGGRDHAIFSSFWLLIPNCCHQSTAEPVSLAIFMGNLPKCSASWSYFTSLVFIKVTEQYNCGRQPGFVSWHYNLKDVRISV